MSVPRLQDVWQTIIAAVVAAINDNSIPTASQVVMGWPASTELVKILNQQQYQVTVFDRGTARNETRYPPIARGKKMTPTLVATIAGDTVTFSGTIASVMNVHVFVGSPIVDVAVQTTATDTLDTIASKVAAAVNATAIAGVSATATAASVAITGSPALRCNIGTTGNTVSAEVSRIARSVQVSVWSPNPTTRFVVADAILSNIGTANSRYLTLSDGSRMEIEYQTDFNDDTVQSSYSLYQAHIVFAVEYGIESTSAADEIAGISISHAFDAFPPTTTYAGG